MTPPLRNRLRVTEHMDAKVDIEIADQPQRKRRRAHPRRGRHIRGRRTPNTRVIIRGPRWLWVVL